MRKALTLAVLAACAAALVATAASGGKQGFKTSQGPMVTPTVAGATYEALITVGDMLPGGYMFESIPDGIALDPNGKGTVDVWVNHETSRVPFPAGFNDFTNAMVSHLKLHQKSGGILSGSYAIESSENWQRFCSSFLAAKEHGFEKPLLLTNEEGIDWVNRTGEAWPATIGAPEARQIGTVVALDVKSGKSRPIWGMGRHNHENSVAIPGYGKPVVLSGDDTFVSNPAQSQLYSYVADSGKDVWNDEGELYAFVTDVPGIDDYYDFPINSPMSVPGRFVHVPKAIAVGRNPDGTDMMAADAGYPPPPNTGWQTFNGVGIDGPQWVLEHWGDTQPQPVFQFVRVEDIAYDKRPGMQNVVYVVDSGRGLAGAPGPGVSSNGRVFKLVLDPNDPLRVLSFSILIEGDDRPVRDPDRIHQPDNIESTPNGLLIQEDPGSSQQFPVGSDNPASPNFDPRATTARIWQYRWAAPMRVVAKVDQSADEGPTDVDTTPRGNLGAWESSGIVDVSHVFGPGAFLVDVQAGTLVIQQAPGAGGQMDQRDGGQLGLLRIPGA